MERLGKFWARVMNCWTWVVFPMVVAVVELGQALELPVAVELSEAEESVVTVVEAVGEVVVLV